MELIQEAIENGARLKKACEVLEISDRTFQRWKSGALQDKRKGTKKRVPRKLTEEERQQVIDTACNERFRDCNPHEIVAILLQEGTYIASVSTFYRILKVENKLHHRRESKPGKKRDKPPELKATGPNQVFSWDITYLPTTVKGLFLYAYMIIDVWSRKIVGWAIHAEESEDHAIALFHQLALRYNLQDVKLHSDNGSTMKGATILMTLYMLGVATSFSRPRVSDDNPYIESFFKTLKYTAGYPKQFRDLTHAREWVSDFVDWYNTKHRHSKIGYITPEQRHSGEGEKIMKKRNQTLQKAYEKNPERWSRKRKVWIEEKVVFLNPSRETKENALKKSA